MWELDNKKGWALKNWCFWTVVLEKTLESPLDCKEIQPVHPKGNQPWIFIGWTDAETEAPIIWPHYMKSQLIGKDSDPRKDWRQEEKGTTEDETVGWHHRLNGHEFEQTIRWWRTGKPGMLQSMGSQRIRHSGWTKTGLLNLVYEDSITLIIRKENYRPISLMIIDVKGLKLLANEIEKDKHE